MSSRTPLLRSMTLSALACLVRQPSRWRRSWVALHDGALAADILHNEVTRTPAVVRAPARRGR